MSRTVSCVCIDPVWSPISGLAWRCSKCGCSLPQREIGMHRVINFVMRKWRQFRHYREERRRS